MKTASLVPAILALSAGIASAQPSNLASSHKFCWSENTGWINFKDAGAPSGSQGVFIGSSFLAGFAWSENIGWINFGDGSPAGGSSYANLNGADFGVNRVVGSGDLYGLAWSENAGWINFGWAGAGNPDRPRFEGDRLRGYAWGENVGWMNLDDHVHYVGFGCAADLDDGSGNGTPDGGVTVDDLLYFLVAFEAGAAGADLDDGSGLGTPDGGVTIDDLLFFLLHFEAGC